MSNLTNDRISLADYELEVRRSSQRKTLEIIVERNGQLIVHAPESLPLEQIAEIAERRKVWILNKLAEKKILLKSFKAKEFVTGETFYFLGRPYRLRLSEEQPKGADPMWLDEGRLMISRAAAENGNIVFQKFCTDQGKEWLKERVQLFAPRIGVKSYQVAVRELGFRWGSCSLNGTINFHWKTMTLPPKMIDYIVVHELTHLIDKTHSKTFWQRIRRIIPDFEKRMQWLAENGVEYAG